MAEATRKGKSYICCDVIGFDLLKGDHPEKMQPKNNASSWIISPLSSHSAYIKGPFFE
jgi:hypothetical protein